MTKKVLMIFGTRPEAIKMAPVFHALNKFPDLSVQVCATGQHREMLDQVITLFDIPITIDLQVMTEGQDLFSLTSLLLMKLRPVLDDFSPDCILVHGDTTTSMAAALAGFYRNIPVGHVEAGLRTGKLRSPFPEEFNRRVSGIIAQWHFAPTQINKDNLLAEQVDESQIFVTGNTVVDALHQMRDRINEDDKLKTVIQKQLAQQLDFDPKDSERMILLTCHRRENFGEGLTQICSAVRSLATSHPTTHFIFPVHLNPNISEHVHATLGSMKNVHLLKPVSYEVFCYLLDAAYLVLTDSGGVQEEAPSLGKPVLVMRENTERPEAVTAGTVRLVGADSNRIIAGTEELLTDSDMYKKMSQAHNPYGDGNAAIRIAEIIRRSVT
jgi:UDP-N-acetylglucosamine 2-epimerase (non-hydrolysing)